eukprot:60115_1
MATTNQPYTPPPSLLESTFWITTCSQEIIHSKSMRKKYEFVFLYIIQYSPKNTYIQTDNQLSLSHKPRQKNHYLCSAKTIVPSVSKPNKRRSKYFSLKEDAKPKDDETKLIPPSIITKARSSPRSPLSPDQLQIEMTDDTDYESSSFACATPITHTKLHTPIVYEDASDSCDDESLYWCASASSDDEYAHLTNEKAFAKVSECLKKEARKQWECEERLYKAIYTKEVVQEFREIYMPFVIQTPEYAVDPSTGRYRSVVIRTEEYEADNEEETDLYDHSMSPSTPTNPPVLNISDSPTADELGCSLTDIE